jgi:hypothetical protein
VFSVAVTTLDSLEKVAAPWRSSAQPDHEDDDVESAEQPVQEEELPGKQARNPELKRCEYALMTRAV